MLCFYFFSPPLRAYCFFFFFQAEDGIRDPLVTGVQTCALPISQWQRFVPHIGNMPGQVGRVAYGVRCNTDDAGNMDYICGVEVADFSELPPEMSRVRIPRQHYAVFTHREHISAIRRTWFTIWNTWLPGSGREVADAPDFERYDESFDPDRGTGRRGDLDPAQGVI